MAAAERSQAKENPSEILLRSEVGRDRELDSKIEAVKERAQEQARSEQATEKVRGPELSL